MSKHTPGKWRTGTKVFRTVYADNKLIGVMDRAEDARLVAAAPELLEVARTFQAQLWADGVECTCARKDPCPLCRSTDAISKAIGLGEDFIQTHRRVMKRHGGAFKKLAKR